MVEQQLCDADWKVSFGTRCSIDLPWEQLDFIAAVSDNFINVYFKACPCNSSKSYLIRKPWWCHGPVTAASTLIVV